MYSPFFLQDIWQWVRGLHQGGPLQTNPKGGGRGVHRGGAGRHHCRSERFFCCQLVLLSHTYLQIDADGSGTIDFEEFVMIMNWLFVNYFFYQKYSTNKLLLVEFAIHSIQGGNIVCLLITVYQLGWYMGDFGKIFVYPFSIILRFEKN